MNTNDPTSKEAARELCRRLGIDPEVYWGIVNDFACDCFFQGQQSSCPLPPLKSLIHDSKEGR